MIYLLIIIIQIDLDLVYNLIYIDFINKLIRI